MILLDVSFERGDACLLFSEGGRKTVLRETYEPHFYALCREPDEAAWLISRHPAVIRTAAEDGAVKVATSLADFRRVVQDIRLMEGVSGLAETSVPHHFRCTSGKGLVFFGDYDRSLRRLDDGDELWALGKLRLGTVTPSGRRGGGPGRAGYGNGGGMSERPGGWTWENGGAGFVIRDGRGEGMPLAEASEKLDVVFSSGGDSFLRGAAGVATTPSGCLFRRMIHIDVKADMEHDIYNEARPPGSRTRAGDWLLEAGKERLVRVMELSAMTGARPAMVPRMTAGRLNVFLHMAAARRMGMRIPDVKKSMEMPKTLRLLRIMDKGGTVLYPAPGTCENVAKCDFSSMYPNIIVRHNISPETMHCACGDDSEVPEAGWRICRKKGLIPAGLEAVLRRRLELKRLMKSESVPGRRRVLDLRQRALKNILVTCFGYLGFKNFIFSNVECKECVMLYGRLILERTKAMAEEEGLEVVYGMVDSVFVSGGTRRDYERFASDVSAEMGFELELDCIFRKLAFPPSADGSGAANKYYGITADGRIEARGIALRHSDAPLFVKEFQERAIRKLLGEPPEPIGELVREYEEALRDRRIGPDGLAITKRVGRGHYATRQAHAIAHRRGGGAGGSVTFVHTMDGPKPLEMARSEVPDHKAYIRILRKSAEELMVSPIRR
jgi:hypothetical protein